MECALSWLATDEHSQDALEVEAKQQYKQGATSRAPELKRRGSALQAQHVEYASSSSSEDSDGGRKGRQSSFDSAGMKRTRYGADFPTS